MDAPYVCEVVRLGFGPVTTVEVWQCGVEECGCPRRVKFLGVGASEDIAQAFERARASAGDKMRGLSYWMPCIREPSDEPGVLKSHAWHSPEDADEGPQP